MMWSKVRLIPHILNKNVSFFSLKDCKYRVGDNIRNNTARVVAW